MANNIIYKSFYPVVSLLINDKINKSKFIIKTQLMNSGLDLKKEIENEREILSYNKIRLVSSGFLINDFYSLQYQGIKNGSIIYLISENYKKNMKIYPQEIENSHKLYLNKNSITENLYEKSRLVDIFRSRVESNPRAYRKIIKRYKDLQNDSNQLINNKKKRL